jgi:hypothetical protein
LVKLPSNKWIVWLAFLISFVLYRFILIDPTSHFYH